MPALNSRLADRIAAWLLESEIQIREGPEAGAVAGWLDATGRPEFGYPEITGYYLTCLSFMRRAGRTEAAIAANAHRAVAWLHSKRRCGAPLTRYYVQDHAHDWRNDAAFSFDIAMLLRGLASAEGLVDEPLRRETVEAFQRGLHDFVSPDRQILPCLRRSRKKPPDGWSTRPGPFQLKTAAAVLSLDYAPRNGLSEACLNTFARWRSFPDQEGYELHAALYAIEGLILFGLRGCEQAWEFASDRFEQCLARFTCERSDVLAQLLRAGCVLRRRGLLRFPDAGRTLDRLAELLTGFVGERGDVVYSLSASEQHRFRNAWSAMFAYQAFTLHQEPERTEAVESLLC